MLLASAIRYVNSNNNFIFLTLANRLTWEWMTVAEWHGE